MNTEISRSQERELEIDISLRILTLYGSLNGIGLIKTQSEYCEELGISSSFFTEIKKGRSGISPEKLQNISPKLSKYKEWLITGKNSPFTSGDLPFLVLKPDKKKSSTQKNRINEPQDPYVEEKVEGHNKNLIPFYDDVVSIGGMNDKVASVEGVSNPSDYIDTGDWFKDATAALRHYGDSMDEYPPGCILALKEVNDKDLIVWGKDYVIETSEYRITKRLQKGTKEGYVCAYSSNTETYPDGRLRHEPLDIPVLSIGKLLLVLGYVVKKNGGTMVFSGRK